MYGEVKIKLFMMAGKKAAAGDDNLHKFLRKKAVTLTLF